MEWTSEHRERPSSVVFVFPKLMFMEGKNWQMQGRAWTPDPAKTLADFRWWWNGLLESPTVLIPRGFSRKASIARSLTLESLRGLREKSAKSYPVSGYAFLGRLDTASAFKPSLLRIHLGLGGGPQGDLAYIGNFIDKGVTVSVTIPIVVYWEAHLSQQKLLKCFPNWQLGHFDRSFSDLAQAAKGLEALELEDVKRIVSEDAARGSEVLEVFGLKFPVGKVTVWSTLVLLCIQLYFFVYLRQLSGKLGQTDEDWDVPWIGMDQSRLARCLLLTTIVFLPCISLGFWGVVTTFQQWDRWVAVKVFGFVSSLILGVLCWKRRPQPKAVSQDSSLVRS